MGQNLCSRIFAVARPSLEAILTQPREEAHSLFTVKAEGLNPLEQRYWPYTQSIQMIQEIFGTDRMVPMTLSGIDAGMRSLSR